MYELWQDHVRRGIRRGSHGHVLNSQACIRTPEHSHRPAVLRRPRIAASGPPSRAIVLGCQIDRLSMPQTLARCEELIARRDFAQHVAINAAKLVAMQRDPELRRIVEACELVSADGQSVVWASRLLGDPLPERVAGIDLMFELFALAERRGFRVFILGARADVLDQARTKVLARHPRLQLVGARDGYFAEHEEAEVAEEVRTARPDILFVAMSSPRKEYWLGRYARTIDVPFVMGVGGAIDVVAGITRRAPAPFSASASNGRIGSRRSPDASGAGTL